MDAEIVTLRIERVANGWMVHGWTSEFQSRDGYVPRGTFVAATPDKLSSLIHEWASKQQDTK